MEALQFWKRSPRLRLAVVMPRAAKRALRFTPHSHTFHELAFVLEGGGDWYVNGTRHRLQVGDLLLVPAGAIHHEKTAARSRARIGWIGFDFDNDPAAAAPTSVPAALCTPLAADLLTEELRRLFETTCAEHQGDDLGHAERAELMLREILILLCRLASTDDGADCGADAGVDTRVPAPSGPAPQLVRSAALTLTGNLSQPMRIRDLAHYHSLSASHFALLFRKHHGATPRRYLQNARLARAKTLLDENALTVKEIAAACGYVDAAHFCHAFKAATNLTPKQFRQRAA